MKIAFWGAGLIAICFLLLFGGVGVVGAATVVDGNTGSPIERATVTVEGTDFSAKTASDGTYTITNIPIGVYTVTATKIGYQSQSYTNVEVKRDETTTVDFALESLMPTFVYTEEILFAVGGVVVIFLILGWGKKKPLKYKTKKSGGKHVKSHLRKKPSRRK